MGEHFSYWVNDIYTTLELEFLELLDFYHHQPRKRIVHQMRLNLKKQLAFFKLIQLPIEPLQQNIHIIRRFQKLLGKIRNAQVLRRKAKVMEQTLGIKNTISKQFKDQEQEYTADWLHYYQKESIALAMQGIREGLALSYQHLSLEAFQQNIKEQMLHLLFEIKGLSNISIFDTGKFHELRTHLKQLISFKKWLQLIFHNLPFTLAIEEDVRQIDHSIGEWHDYVSLLKDVDKDEEQAFVFAVEEQIEVYTLEARSLLPKLEALLDPIEAYLYDNN